MDELKAFLFLSVSAWVIYFLSRNIANSQQEKGKSPGCLMALLYGVVLTPLIAFAAFAAIVCGIFLLAKSPILGILVIGFIIASIIFFEDRYSKWKKKKTKCNNDKSEINAESINPTSTQEFTPNDGKYLQDHLDELEAFQSNRKMQDAHYKLAVIDFETTGLDPNRDEILQVSIIDEDENVLINQLCKPEHTEQWESAWKVNGIYPGYVRFCPTFAQVMPYVQDILSRAEVVIAYNYPFEPNFLRNNGIDPDSLTWGPDPMKLAVKYYNKQYHSSRLRMKLSDAADMIGYTYKAHDALEDVKATLHVYNFLTGESQAMPTKQPKQKAANKKHVQNVNADVNHPLYNKTIVFTGDLSIDREEAAERAANLGAKVRTKVSGKTDILVCGERPDALSIEYGNLSVKYKDALELNESGKADIEFMDEDDFMALLD